MTGAAVALVLFSLIATNRPATDWAAAAMFGMVVGLVVRAARLS